MIEGGIRLKGDVRISGSKNASLPILAASLLTPEKCVISGLPRLADVETMLRMLTELGVQVAVQGSQVTIQARELQRKAQLQQYAKKMRASFLLMGPLLARQGEACMELPGGCAIGRRPVDLHLKGLAALGAEIQIEKGFVRATARRLRGAEIALEFPSVGATENIMMAAACASGMTTLINAAAEPEIVDLADFLNKMGADIRGAGTGVICIKGTPNLKGAVHTVIPDRIEAGTYMAAVAATGGEARLVRVIPEHLRSVIEKFREAGVCIEEGDGELFVSAPQELRPLDISTSPYPGFPTDMQPQFVALLTTARGTSRVSENIFENRFLYIQELVRMSASIEVTGNTAVIHGVTGLRAACVKATDLRAGAALVIAALKAWGETDISGLYHLDRGYEDLEEKLSALGCRIRRVTEQAANL